MARTTLSRLALVAVTAWTVSAGVTAQAQDDAAQPNDNAQPMALKLGAFIPTNRSGSSSPGTAQFLAEIEYRFGRTTYNPEREVDPEKGSNLSYLASAGYSEKSGLKIVPATVAVVYRVKRPGSDNNPYFGAGLGLYITRGPAPETDGKTKGLFGGYGVAGLDINKDVFVEVKYHVVSRYEARSLDGLQLTAGVRF